MNCVLFPYVFYTFHIFHNWNLQNFSVMLRQCVAWIVSLALRLIQYAFQVGWPWSTLKHQSHQVCRCCSCQWIWTATTESEGTKRWLDEFAELQTYSFLPRFIRQYLYIFTEMKLRTPTEIRMTHSPPICYFFPANLINTKVLGLGVSHL